MGSDFDMKAHAMKVFDLASRMKKAMLKKGLRRARAVCPRCPDKYLNGSINGPRDHIHMVCDCRKLQIME